MTKSLAILLCITLVIVSANGLNYLVRLKFDIPSFKPVEGLMNVIVSKGNEKVLVPLVKRGENDGNVNYHIIQKDIDVKIDAVTGLSFKFDSEKKDVPLNLLSAALVAIYENPNGGKSLTFCPDEPVTGGKEVSMHSCSENHASAIKMSFA